MVEKNIKIAEEVYGYRNRGGGGERREEYSSIPLIGLGLLFILKIVCKG